MIEEIILNNLDIDNDYKDCLKDIFKHMKILPSKLVLGINLFSTYILKKRGVI